MKVWLLNASEQLSYTGSERRRMRTGLLARALIQRGHQVLWWKSTFEHVSKRHLREDSGFEEVEPGLTVGWIHSRGYSGHVSLSRLIDHMQVGLRFGPQARRQTRPDVIVCSMPIPDLSLAGAHYGRRNGIPVVIDVRDWWPEALVYTLPPRSRRPTQGLLAPYALLVRMACRNATAITGITDEFVEWGLLRSGRGRNEFDRAIPHGYEIPQIPDERRDEARRYWDALGVSEARRESVVTFIGSITRTFDFSSILEAARRLQASRKPVRFVLCGDGDRLEETRRLATGLSNVTFSGEWVGPGHIRELLARSSIGLVPLPSRPDFLATINNKTIEYLSAGVPVLVSPRDSHAGKLIIRESCGEAYSEGDSESLPARIARLMEDEQALVRMSRNARRLFEERYSADKVYDDFAAYLEDLSAAFPTLRSSRS